MGTNYLAVLFLVTGTMNLLIDTRDYKKRKLKKEQKTARFLGWGGIIIGGLVFAGNWVMEKFIW